MFIIIIIIIIIMTCDINGSLQAPSYANKKTCPSTCGVRATIPATFCFARVSHALNQLTSGAQVYTQLQLESMIDHDISCFSLLFPNVDADWYLLHLSKGTSKSPWCSCNIAVLLHCFSKSDTILPPQEIQLEDGKSGQTPQLEPASRWDLWHKLSLQCLEMLHTQQLLLARIVKLKKARVFYNWQVFLPFVPNIYIALEMLRFDFTNFNKYTLK